MAELSLIFNAFDTGDGVAAVGMTNSLLLTPASERNRSAYHVGARWSGAVRSHATGRCRRRRRRRHPGLAFDPTASTEDAEERVAESFPEVFVEVGVDERVQRRVEIADPEEHLDDDVRTVARFPAQRDWEIPTRQK